MKASLWSAACSRIDWPMTYHPPPQAEAMLYLLEDLADPDLPLAVVRWAGEAGIVLVPSTSLDLVQSWDGRVTVAGYVDRLHVRQVEGDEFLVAEIVGQALPIGYHTLATRKDMRSGFLAIPRDRAMTTDEYVYPFLLEADSSFAMLAQDALVSGLAVDVAGHFASDDDPRRYECGLPLIPEFLTVFSAG